MITYTTTPTGWPVTILVGQANAGASRSITRYVDLGTVRIEESGNNESATCSFDFIQEATSVPSNYSTQFDDWAVPEGTVLFRHGSDEVFQGFIRQLNPVPEGISRRVSVTAYDIGTILDKIIVAGTDARPAGESDKARIQYLLAAYGQPLENVIGNQDFSQVQVLEADMPKQKFVNQTLRQAIEQVLGAASPTANYYIDPVGRLHTFDNDNPEGLVAPYEVVTKATGLASDECVVSDLSIEWDTSQLINHYKVRGKNASASIVISNSDSVARYGRRSAVIDAPDADTTDKATRVGLAALADTKNPLVRGSFTVEGAYVTRSGSRWRPGQKVFVTSAFHGLLRQPYRIVRVTTTYVSGVGDRQVSIEFGALKRRFNPGGSLS